MSKADETLTAFAISAKALETLTDEQRRRVLKALIELYGVKGV